MFCLGFCSIIWFFAPENVSEKILLMSGPLFEKIFRSELLFFGVGVGRVFFVLFCLCFCSIIWFFASGEFFLDVRSCVSGFFGLAVRSFFRGGFRALKCPMFAAQMRHVISSPFLVFFRSFFALSLPLPSPLLLDCSY